jgi:hypothetical protein
MNYTLQNLDYAKYLIETRLRENNKNGDNTSLSGLFTLVRKNDKFSFIGDYPIISYCSNFINPTRSDFQYASTKSKEYKELRKREKMRWVDSLMMARFSNENFRVEAKSKTKTAGN